MIAKHAVAAAGLALALMGGAAHATTFDYTGGFQSFVAPTAGIYDITSYGAQGGGADGTTSLGGQGAEVGVDFTLAQGEQLTVLVGGMGGPGGPGNDITLPFQGGGGGGSFVYTPPIQGIPTFLQVPPYGPLNPYTGYVQLADAGGGLGGSSTNFPAGGDGQAGEGPNPGGTASQSPELAGDGAGYLYSGINNGAGFAPAFGGRGGVDIAYAGYGPGGDGHGGFGGGGEYVGGALSSQTKIMLASHLPVP